MSERNQLLNDPEEAVRTALDGRQAALWTAMPAVVTKVTWSKMTIEAQITIQGLVTNSDGTEQYVNLPKIVDVPIVFPSAGGFTITLPIAAGDEVLIIFASRCIDAWWQSGGVNIPAELRMHDLSDGFAIPGPHSAPKVISSISTTAAQVRNNAGTSYVELGADGKIKLVSPTEIDITAPVVAVTGGMTVSGALAAGSLAVTGGGAATVAGSLNVTGQVTASGIPLSTHKHTGVTTGGGTSGGPTP